MKPQIGKKYYVATKSNDVVKGKCVAVFEDFSIIDFPYINIGEQTVLNRDILSEVPSFSWKKFFKEFFK